MKMKGNLTFLIGVAFVMLVFVSMTMTGCAAKQHTTYKKKQRGTMFSAPAEEDEVQPPQPGQPDQPAK